MLYTAHGLWKGNKQGCCGVTSQIRTPILKEISLYSDRFGFEPEITAKLARRKCKIVEVPISYRGRDYHEGKTVSWKDGIAAIFHILRFRFFS